MKHLGPCMQCAHNAGNKGQLISECLFDVSNFPKNQHKNLMNLCPRI
jgi:hypothetical protein